MRTYVCGVVAMLMPALAWATGGTPATIDAPSLMGEPKPVVAKMLGAPSKCERIKYGERCAYKGRHEVVFIKGKADWLTLYVDAPMSTDVLKAIGFQPEPPDNRTGGDMRWNSGLRTPIRTPDSLKALVRPEETVVMPVEAITAVQGADGKVAYIYVKTSTP